MLAIAGDVEYGFVSRPISKVWMEDIFMPWCAEISVRDIEIMLVAGNHDFTLQDHQALARRGPWRYLQDSGITIDGVKFWGSPWQPWFGGWAFNAPEFDPAEEFLEEKFSQIPGDTDVLITHGPPLGILDRVWNRHCGSKALNKHVQRVMPKLHVFGHIHHSFGVEQVESVTCANVSQTKVVKGEYLQANQPVLFEI